MEPTASSYGAVVYTLAALQGQYVLALLIMGGYTLARSWCGLLDGQRRTTFDNTMLLWHYAVAQGLVTLLLVHGFPLPDAGMTKLTGAPAQAVTWHLWVAPLVWAAHFLAIYTFTALACARKDTAGWFGVGTVPWFVGTATLVAAGVLLLTIAIAVHDGRRSASSPEPSPVRAWLTAAIASLVLLAVLWETLPVLLVPVCS